MPLHCQSCRKLLPVSHWFGERSRCAECEARREAARAQYAAAVADALRDHTITPEEWAFLEGLRARLQLNPQDVLLAHRKLFEGRYRKVVEDGMVTPQELAWLRRLQAELRLPEEVAGEHLSFAQRLHQLQALQSGPLPVVANPPLALQRGERCHWVEPRCNYIEERSRREWVAGSQGVSIRIARGLTYRIGATRGHSYSVPYDAVVDTGALAVTSKRLAFVGERRGFSIPYAKILSFRAFENAIQVQRDAMTAKPQTFTVADAEAVATVLSRCMGEAAG